MSATHERRTAPRWRPWTLGAIALALLGVTIVQRIGAPGAPSPADEPTFEVRRGPMTISFTLSGTILAAEQVIISSEVPGQYSLIYLIDEGRRVTNGELLVELDSSALKESLVQQQIRVQNAEAAFVRARESMSVARDEADSQVKLAELRHRFAREDLTQYREGKYPQDRMQAQSRITLAEEELQLASRKLEWSEKLFQENYLSQSDLESDRLTQKRARLNLEMARADLKLLEEFTFKRESERLESEVEQARLALDRIRLKTAADLVQAEADLHARELEWRRQQDVAAHTEDLIARTRIVAPRDGVVVYATSVRQGSGRRGAGQEPLATGQMVRERQELIYLPTADEMIASIMVHESHMDKVRMGLPAVVTVDALPGKTFLGAISRIAPLPDPGSLWMNADLKVYPSEIKIEGRHPEMRPGMSCMVEIVVERYDDAVYVPVQAVQRIGNRHVVYAGEPGDFRPVEVEVGLDNNRMVRILSGLAEGQTVMLAPPLREGEAGGAEDKGPADGEKLRAMIDAASNAPADAASPAEPDGGGTR